MSKLEGKVAVITGGNSGIGLLRHNASPRRARTSLSRAAVRANSTQQ